MCIIHSIQTCVCIPSIGIHYLHTVNTHVQASMAIKKPLKAKVAKPYIAQRPSKVEQCARCRVKVLVGLDADACAFSVRIDPAALTREGELIYIVAGVKMFALKTSGQILRRSHAEILKRAGHFTIHLEHVCDTVVPAHLLAVVEPKVILVNGDDRWRF